MVSGSGRCPALFVDQFWAGFIHLQRPVIQTCAVHSRDRSPSLFGTGHLDEGKPTGLTCITILYDCDTLDCAMRLEEHSQLLFTCFEVKISNENVRHGLNVHLSMRLLKFCHRKPKEASRTRIASSASSFRVDGRSPPASPSDLCSRRIARSGLLGGS